MRVKKPSHPSPLAGALLRFLTADPDQWPRLAPQVIDAVGAERLARVVDATRRRTGGFTRVTDGPDGLVVHGPRGRVLAWAQAGADGVLTGLRLDGTLYAPKRTPRWVRRVLPLAAGGAVVAARIWSGRHATTVSGWAADVLVVAAMYVVFEGYAAPALLPPWLRRPIEAAGLLALAPAYRLHHLGGVTGHLVFGLVVFGGAAGLLLRNRAHRWGASLSAPLRFPLDGGPWYVVQGGGRLLNHHASIPEQRGALDLVRLGAAGSRTRRASTVEAYAAYGAKVYAPCAGRVVSSDGGQPDQRPGVIRYGPAYGNHVFIDTGHEVVKLAHLREGSVPVTAGQTVRAGQLVGEIGNSGNTTEPHLHLHAERDGMGLDLEFAGVTGRLFRGRKVTNGEANGA